MKAADAHGNARGAQRPRDIDGARKLIGLHADQPDQPAASALAYLLDDRDGPDAGVRLVPGGDADLDVLAQHPASRAIQRKSVQRASVFAGIEERAHWMT